MNQPELGLKIVELRKQKGLTQEDLAEECNLNVRSIQRIEKGEVEPRSYTLNILSNVLEFDFNKSDELPEKEQKLWFILLHLTNFFPIVILPLLIQIYKKDQIPGLEKQAKDVMNFQLSLIIYMFCSAILVFLVIGVLILISLSIFIAIITFINLTKAAAGREYNYPFTIQIID